MSSLSSKNWTKASSKVEFVRLFFGRNVGLKKSFWICLTFNVICERPLCKTYYLFLFIQYASYCWSQKGHPQITIFVCLWHDNCHKRHFWWPAQLPKVLKFKEESLKVTGQSFSEALHFAEHLSLEFSCIELVIQWTICHHIVG